MSRVALVTCKSVPAGNSDDLLVLPHLAALGVTAEPAVWTDLKLDWSIYDAVIIRSTWDYHLHIADFLQWLGYLVDLGVAVWNMPAVLRWNSDKRYLLELQKRGVNIVPTKLLTRNQLVNLPHVLQSSGWSKAVVKPTISASAHSTWLTEPATAERDQRQLMAMMLHSDVLVQPLMSEVMKDGVYSFVFFAGAYSHCLRKLPRAGDYRTQSEFGGQTRLFAPPDDWISQASAILEQLPLPQLYARVDCIVRDNALMLMELELIEPWLGLGLAPGAPARFAAAIALAARRALEGRTHGALPDARNQKLIE